MRSTLLSTTAIALALLAGVAVARAQDPRPPATTMSGPAIDTDKLIGRPVLDANDEKVGTIESLLIDKDGKVRFAVVGIGGFLGMGERQAALPWEALAIAANGGKVTIAFTREQLKAMPEYRYAEPSRRGTVYSWDEDLKTNRQLATAPMPNHETPPLAGANSFTETQARDRIVAAGYTVVIDLKKDDKSIWRGTAMKDGKSVAVALDYKGNVVSN